MTSDESVEKIVSVCSETQSMINIAAKQLFGLRQCRETVDLIREEISESESKLALLFGKLLIAKAKLEDGVQLKDFAKMGQWLDIVGVSSSLSEKVCQRYLSISDLLQSDKDSLERELKFLSASEEEVQLLATAMKQLKRATDLLSHDPKLCVNGNWSTAELHWSNFKPSASQQTAGGVGAFSAAYGRAMGQHHGSSPKFQNHHQHPISGTHRSQISGAEPTGIPPSGRQSPQVSSLQFADGTDASTSEFGHQFHAQYPSSFPNTRSTPPSTPQVGKTPRSGKFPTTPPPKRRNKLNPDSFQPLMKSTSHESQLSLKVSQDSKTSRHPKKKPSNINIVGSSEAISTFSPMKSKTSGAPDEAPGLPGAKVSGQSSPLLSSPYRSPQLGKASCEDASVQESNLRTNQLAVPPVSPGNQFMTNSITHKLKKSKLLWGTCDVCRKQLIRGRLCKNCRLKFHNDCVSRAPSICKFYHSFIKHEEDSPEPHHQSRHQQPPHQRFQPQQQQIQQQQHHHHLQQQQQHFDSSSTPSSCNSSTPSSPAVPTSTLSSSTHWTPQQQNFNITHFTYPDTSSGVGSSLSSSSTPTVSVSAADAVNTNTSTDSDKSDKTITGSGDSSGDQNTNCEHLDSIDGSEDLNLRRDNSISVALKEWDIPYQELNVLDAIGEGRFGKVHKGYWHGEVAIKLLNTNPNSEDHAQQLHAFKLEVANLRKTRHENLVLFMGACMDPEHLAIVTSFVKGQTLFSKIYLRKEKFLTNQTIAIASQIAQGLGYLHAKGIVHKDLKTKNVFVENLKPSSSSSENFKVVIGDFGLFSVSKLCQGRGKGQWLSIPHCWLCYLSPEIVKSLTPRSPFDDELPFTKESDIFAFGTVWFELLAGDWPYRATRPETIIWMVGKGVNQPHLNVQSEFKEILLQCWAYQPDLRPNCQQLLKILEKLPRKRLARSPSHPIQLSRSAESIF